MFRKLVLQGAIVVFVLVILSSLATAGQLRTAGMIIGVDKADYARVVQAVEDAGGQVRFQYKNINALAVTIPPDRLVQFLKLPEIKTVQKDLEFSLPQPPVVKRDRGPQITHFVEADMTRQQALSSADLEALLAGPDNYFPLAAQMTHAYEFYNATGHTGEGIIVGIMDSGVSTSASAVASRVLGGENFTGDGVSANSAQNGDHGTWVACCVGANGIFGFGNTAIQNAVKRYSPESVIPNYFGNGIDGIPMVGQAPGALFYALKVFRANGTTSNSIILAAMDRAIELKENYDNGAADGLNLQVVNMSFSGTTLFAGEDPYFAELVEKMWDTGIITVASPGNYGPSGLTVGDPGSAENILTAGATSDATHERIVMDIFYFGPGGGLLYRPVDNNIVADYSSRGPNADGRPDPDIVAPGSWRYAQSANGTTISWVSGTSFSAPTVAGAAALLLSAQPSATPDQIRGALLRGANPAALDDKPSFSQDQGFGYLDVMAAYQKLMAGASNPPDIGSQNLMVAKNVTIATHEMVINSNRYNSRIVNFVPGERKDFFVYCDETTASLTVNISNVTPALPADQQNPLYGDDIYFAIHSAKTSKIGSNGDYLGGTPAFVKGNSTFTVDGLDLDRGVVRVTVMGDFTNAGKVSANISIRKTDGNVLGKNVKAARLAEGQTAVFTVSIPADATLLSAGLLWTLDWHTWPTNDLDLLVIDPAGTLYTDGATLDAPEFVSFPTPMPGTWTFIMQGYTVWSPTDLARLSVNLETPEFKLAGESSGIGGEILLKPDRTALAANFPNPFNPSTTIKYQLAEDALVSVKIYNVRGQLVRSLVDDFQPAGFYDIRWDGHDAAGNTLASGTYIYRMKAGDFEQTRKMILLK